MDCKRESMVFLSSYSAVAKLSYLLWDSVLLGTVSWKVNECYCSCPEWHLLGKNSLVIPTPQHARSTRYSCSYSLQHGQTRRVKKHA